MGKIDRSKLNVVGSSLAYGHPFAATGGRIVATLAKLLSSNGGGRGLISICTAGGMGVTAILESAQKTSASGKETDEAVRANGSNGAGKASPEESEGD